jgi:hypothetical protein
MLPGDLRWRTAAQLNALRHAWFGRNTTWDFRPARTNKPTGTDECEYLVQMVFSILSLRSSLLVVAANGQAQ